MTLGETKSRWDGEAPRLENVFGYNVTSVLWMKKLSPHSYIFHIYKDWYPQGQLTWILFKKPSLWWLHTSTCYRTTRAWTPWLILFGTCFSVVFFLDKYALHSENHSYNATKHFQALVLYHIKDISPHSHIFHLYRDPVWRNREETK